MQKGPHHFIHSRNTGKACYQMLNGNILADKQGYYPSSTVKAPWSEDPQLFSKTILKKLNASAQHVS